MLHARARKEEILVTANEVKGNKVLISLARNYGGAEVDFTCKKCRGDVVDNTNGYSGTNKPCRCDEPVVIMKIVPWVF
jgi:hypothetical protein